MSGKIERFDPSKICVTATIAIIAPRGSGKSYLCRDLINQMRYYPAVCVICPSDKSGSFYNQHIPDSYIYYEFNDKVIEKIIQRQTKVIAKLSDPKYKGKKIDPRLLLVLDDVQSSCGDLKKSKPFNDIFTKGRHMGITLIVVIQDSMGLAPSQRSNLDYVFAYSARSGGEIKKLYEHYFNDVGSNIKEFKEILRRATENRSCLVAQKVNPPGYFFYPPQLVEGEIKIGNSQFKNFHKSKYRENWEKENEENLR